MPKLNLILWRKKKEIWTLVALLGFVTLVNLPIVDRFPLLLHVAFKGGGTTFKEYKIHTGLDYIYHHHEYLGGVSVQKISPGFKQIDRGYYLKFEEGTSKEIKELSLLCERPISTCETIPFDNFIGVTLGTYIEVNDEIINRTIYYNSECDVFISHTGNPFDQIYLDMVTRFFNDSCPSTNS